MNEKTHSQETPSWLGRTLMAVGISGAAFAALCCVAPFIAGLVTALGLGFILNDSILTGLIIVFIGVAALGYYLVQRRTGP